MKKIVFTGDWTLEKMVGIQRYTYRLLCELDKMMCDGMTRLKIELLVPSNSRFEFSFDKIKVIKRGKINSKLDKHIWQQVTFPFYVLSQKAFGIDLTADLPLLGCKVYALHDCIHEAYPENFNGHKKFLKLYLFKVRKICKNKKKQIVTLTNDSKREIQKYYNVSDQRISIVSCGWEHMNDVKEDNNIFKKIQDIKFEKYFFSLGSKYKHKNFQWILKAAAKNPQYRFVITGTEDYSENYKELNQDKLQNVIYTGYISDGEIKALMKHCKALIQPSLYEGFGLPPLETLSQGKPIIVSNKSCLPEIYGDTAYYIDPYSDGCDLDKLMDEKVGSSESVLKKYTWRNAAVQLLQVIGRITSLD